MEKQVQSPSEYLEEVKETYEPVLKKNRLWVQDLLETLLGSRNVYFRPPEEVRMRYPAIVYDYSDLANTHASNVIYKTSEFFTITLIDKNPDSKFVNDLIKIPGMRYDRSYIADGLNHFTFNFRLN